MAKVSNFYIPGEKAVGKPKVRQAGVNSSSTSSGHQALTNERAAPMPGEAEPPTEESADSLASKRGKLAALHARIFRELDESWAKLAKL